MKYNQKVNTYYFLIASRPFLITEEPLEEVLRERIQYFYRTKKRIDFWLLPNPNFVQTKSFKLLKNELPSDSIAVISTNKIFITWLKLRINNVLIGKFSAPTEEIKQPLGFTII